MRSSLRHTLPALATLLCATCDAQPCGEPVLINTTDDQAATITAAYLDLTATLVPPFCVDIVRMVGSIRHDGVAAAGRYNRVYRNIALDQSLTGDDLRPMLAHEVCHAADTQSLKSWKHPDVWPNEDLVAPDINPTDDLGDGALRRERFAMACEQGPLGTAASVVQWERCGTEAVSWASWTLDQAFGLDPLAMVTGEGTVRSVSPGPGQRFGTWSYFVTPTVFQSTRGDASGQEPLHGTYFRLDLGEEIDRYELGCCYGDMSVPIPDRLPPPAPTDWAWHPDHPVPLHNGSWAGVLEGKVGITRGARVLVVGPADTMRAVDACLPEGTLFLGAFRDRSWLVVASAEGLTWWDLDEIDGLQRDQAR